MFERFTERARQVVVLAQEEARMLRHNYVGTEHELLGLLREQEGLAARVLESLGVTIEGVRDQVRQIVGSGEEVTSGQIPFTPRAKKVLELALHEAMALGHNYIGTEVREVAPDRLEDQLAQARREKDEAIDAREWERAGALRDRERRLLAARDGDVEAAIRSRLGLPPR
jgi:ATP-dependent Clp protease ATP-binding subunit ClpA